MHPNHVITLEDTRNSMGSFLMLLEFYDSIPFGINSPRPNPTSCGRAWVRLGKDIIQSHHLLERGARGVTQSVNVGQGQLQESVSIPVPLDLLLDLFRMILDVPEKVLLMLGSVILEIPSLKISLSSDIIVTHLVKADVNLAQKEISKPYQLRGDFPARYLLTESQILVILCKRLSLSLTGFGDLTVQEVSDFRDLVCCAQQAPTVPFLQSPS
jgi:hypothetical protein